MTPSCPSRPLPFHLLTLVPSHFEYLCALMNTIFKPALFEGTSAIITGGGTGIGLRIARELALLGATVILASRKKENLNTAVKQITGR